MLYKFILRSDFILNYNEEALKKHREWKGKIEVNSRVLIENSDDLSLAYTPGVASACLAIKEDPEQSFKLTRRSNLVAVITDGSAVLGLGNIGNLASMPVMEGKCVLLKEFANVDAFPICLGTQDVDEVVRTIHMISGSFGAINLEDIAAPRCFEIERKLREVCDIPVFHDDQHGTAIVVGAGLLNAIKLLDKSIEKVKVVINGAGAAGIAIARHLLNMGFQNIIMVDKKGILSCQDDTLNHEQKNIAENTNKENLSGNLDVAIEQADIFIGVSTGNILTKEMIKRMNSKPIVFAMANPTPEIMPQEAIEAGAAVIGTGRSDFPNQINNVLAFPGIFRGLLDCRAPQVTEEMKVAASHAIADLVSSFQLSSEYILPDPLDKRISKAVARAVIDCYRKSK